jgi:hypothetical protein
MVRPPQASSASPTQTQCPKARPRAICSSAYDPDPPQQSPQIHARKTGAGSERLLPAMHSGMAGRMTRWLLISLFLLNAACGAAAVPAARRPDGGWHLKCDASLARCVQEADDLCKGRGYVVISGFNKRKLYGAELGVSQVEERQAELDIACADKRDQLPTLAPPPPPSQP